MGEWQESIAWNITSSDTAWEMCVSSGVVNSHYTHALDYLTYAYLQMGNDHAIKKILAVLNNLKPPYNKTNHASAYAFAAVPARYAAERYDWTAATELSPRVPMDFPREPSHAPYVAITHFVKAIAFSRLKRPNETTAEIAELYQLSEQTADKQAYWSNQISIQIKSAEAWQLYTNGNVEQSLAMMKGAADMEMATQKHPITPGSVIPANELFGDMLSESGLFEQAISAYNASLQRNPKRLNSLIGIGQSYIEMQDIESATDTLKRINRQVNGASVQRPKFKAITDYVNSAL